MSPSVAPVGLARFVNRFARHIGAIVLSGLAAAGSGHLAAADQSGAADRGADTATVITAHPAIVELCLETKRPPAMCECAARRIAQSHPTTVQHYADVANSYLGKRRDGMRRREAWSFAIQARAAASGQNSSEFSDAIDATAGDHQVAMHACGQEG